MAPELASEEPGQAALGFLFVTLLINVLALALSCRWCPGCGSR